MPKHKPFHFLLVTDDEEPWIPEVQKLRDRHKRGACLVRLDVAHSANGVPDDPPIARPQLREAALPEVAVERVQPHKDRVGVFDPTGTKQFPLPQPSVDNQEIIQPAGLAKGPCRRTEGGIT